MTFSVCIPNYNYAHYLRETIQSVLNQTHADFEILVSDNASTDESVKVIEQFGDLRIRVRVNGCNVGFAGNLDCAGRMAEGDRMILLSSDDLMGPEALATYVQLLGLLPKEGAAKTIISSAEYMIDSAGETTSVLAVHGPPLLFPEDRVPSLEAHLGAPVYRVSGREMLRRSVLNMRNPFHFVTTCYPRRLYDAVGGYGGGRLFNPDKWFHWRLLSVAEEAYFIDRPLFSYRWHTSNQAALQKRSGTLKFLVDEYLNSFELPDQTFSAIGLERSDVERAFVENTIARHGWAVLAKDSAYEARRILRFGQAVYPQHVRRSRDATLLKFALPFGSIAQRMARIAYGKLAHRQSSNL
jgi:glycosyltransferase involved in cell wall biosynthesis